MFRSIFAISAAISAALLLSSTLALAQFRTVTVQNANGNPVPTTIQNTPTVSVSGTVPVTVGNTPTVNVNGTVPVTVSNTPSVNATITGTPSVSISGTPAVNATIVNTPSVSISGTPSVAVTNFPATSGTVTVGNTVGQPVPVAGTGNIAAAPVIVRDNDQPARQPFQESVQCNMGPGAGGNICTFPTKAPVGKELVIEFVTMQCLPPDNTQVCIELDMATVAGGVGVTHHFGPVQILGSAYSNQAVRIYADPNTSIFFVVSRSSGTGTTVAVATLSGYLVNLP